MLSLSLLLLSQRLSTIMNHSEHTPGWFKLALLWVASFIPDNVADATIAQVLTALMIVLTILQIIRTSRDIFRGTKID